MGRYMTDTGPAKSALFDIAALESTVDRLVTEGQFSAERGEAFKRSLPESIGKSAYVVSQLAAHAAIGAVFAYDLIPIPLGTVARVMWVAGNRLYWTLRRDPLKKAVHSWGVMGIAAIPWVGYIAYTIPLRRTSEDLCYVYANRLTLKRSGQSLDQYLAAKPRFIRRLIERMVVPKEIDNPGE